MTQLWLDNKRIEDVDELRLFFSEHDDNQVVLCCTVFERLRDGILGRWAAQQVEYFRRPAEGRPAILDLLEGSDDDRIGAVASLCGVSVEVARKAYEAYGQTWPCEMDPKRALVEQQPWFSHYKAFFETVQWSHVVVNDNGNDAFNDLLRKLHENRCRDEQARLADIYLCDVTPPDAIGKPPFVIRDILHLHHVVLTGFGAPNVQFGSSFDGQEFDFAERKVLCAGFSPNTQGAIVSNMDGRTNLEVEKDGNDFN